MPSFDNSPKVLQIDGTGSYSVICRDFMCLPWVPRFTGGRDLRDSVEPSQHRQSRLSGTSDQYFDRPPIRTTGQRTF